MNNNKRWAAFGVVAAMTAGFALVGPINFANAVDCTVNSQGDFAACTGADTIIIGGSFAITSTITLPDSVKTIVGNNETITAASSYIFTWHPSTLDATITFEDLTLAGSLGTGSLLNLLGNSATIPNQTEVTLSDVKFDMTNSPNAWAVMVVQSVSKLNFTNGCEIDGGSNLPGAINYDVNYGSDPQVNVLSVDFSGLKTVSNVSSVMYSDATNFPMPLIQVDPSTVSPAVSSVSPFFENTKDGNSWPTVLDAMMEGDLGVMTVGDNGAQNLCWFDLTHDNAPAGSSVTPVPNAITIFHCGDPVTLPATAQLTDTTGTWVFQGWTINPVRSGTFYRAGMTITDSSVISGDIMLNGQWAEAPETSSTGATQTSTTGTTQNNNQGGSTTSGVGSTASQVQLMTSSSSTTGGSGRVANGQDTQVLQVALGGNQVGSTTGFSITSVPAGVTLASVTSTGTGSFQLALTSDTPGIYRVSVQYNGVTIGTVSNVNFIDGSVSAQAIAPGGTQILTGQGFLPGEMVTITVHSDPIQVGRLAADANGNVQVSFVIPKNFGLGSHEAIFTGDKSGSVSVPFQVTTTLVSTGGSLASTSSAGLAGLLVMAGLAAAALIWRRRTTFAS